MQVGDLVSFIPDEGRTVGVIVRRVAMYRDTVEVLWPHGLGRCSTEMLEVLNESR